MPDPKVVPQTETHDPLVDYVSDKYYDGGRKEEIHKKLTSDESAFDKALGEVHANSDHGENMTLQEFKNNYYSTYGNPFEKKKPSQSSGLPKPESQELPQETLGISYAPEKKTVEESGNGSLSPSDKEWEGTVSKISDDDKTRKEKYQQQVQEQQTKPEEQGQLESASNTFTRRIADLPNQLAEGIAILGKKFNEIAPNPFNLPGNISVSDYLLESAKANRHMLDEIGIKDGDPRHPLTNSVATGVADIATMLATGGLTKEAEAIAALSEASTKSAVLTNVAGQTVKQLTSPTALIAGTQIASAEYKQAIQSGATEKQATDVAIQNWAVGGQLESLPIAQFFKRIDKVTGGGFQNWLKNAAINGIKQGGEEAITEIAQQYYSNYTAGQTYDATRKWYDGMTESGGIGFGLGFALGAMGTSLRKRQHLAQTPEEKTEIQKAIDLVDEKSADLQSGKLTDQGKEVKIKEQPGEITGVAQANEESSLPVEEVMQQSEPGSEPVINSNEPVANETTEAIPNQETQQDQAVENIIPDNTQVESDTTNPEPTEQIKQEENDQANSVLVQSDKSGVLQTPTEDVQSESEQKVTEPEKEESPIENEIIQQIKDDKDIPELKSKFDTPEDFETVKEYIDDQTKESTIGSDKELGGESQVMEEGKTEEGEGIRPIRAIRDKSKRLRDTPEGIESRQLAKEIIKDVDSEIAKIIPVEESIEPNKNIVFEKPDGSSIKGTILSENEDGTFSVQGTNKLKYRVKPSDIITYEDAKPQATEIKEEGVNTRSHIVVSTNANKGKTDINNMMGITMMGDVLGINVNDITRHTKKGKDFFQKWLTARGFIPEGVFKSWLNTEGKINSELTKMKYTVADFRRTVKSSYNLGLGKELSPTIKTEINAALSGDKKVLATLPLEVQEAVSEMRAHVDYLSQRMVDEGIVKGDLVAKFQENSGIYLFRSYRKHDDPDWVQEIDPQIVNRAKAYIEQQLPDLTQDEIDGVINELLYTPEAPMNLIKTGKLGSKDLSILKKRKDLAPEIRALYGEYTDPLVNYSKSIMKMTNIIEKHKFLENVRSQGMDKFLFEKATSKFSREIAGEKTATMAPLNGLYTTPEIAEAFAEFNAAQNLPKWMEYYMKAISTVKAAKTIFNATTHARNVLGNLAFVIANGHYQLNEGIDAFKTIKTDILDSDNDKFRQAYRHYQELGIVGDGGSAAELKTMLQDAKLKPDKFDYVNTRMIDKARKATTEFIGDLYQAEDDFYKIYAFENEFSKYEKAYPDKTKAEIEQIAADIVKNTYPTYSKTAKLIKEMRKAPILGTFISFPAEVIRTTYNTAAITKQELSSDNPKVRSIGAQRLAGQLISASLTAGLAAFTKYLYGISDKEEEKVRLVVAPWSKNSLFFYTSSISKGNVNMVDLSQTDPHGFWQKPIMAILDGNGTPLENAGDAAAELMEPFVGMNMITEALINAKSNKKTTGQDITNTSLPIGDQILDYTKYLYDFTKPGTLASFDRIYKGYKLQGHPDEYGKVYKFGNEVLAAVGGQRISSIDASKSFSFLSGDMKEQFHNSKKIYTGYKLVEQPYMSESEKEDIKKGREEALNKSVDALKKDVKEMRKLYFGVQGLGISPKDLKGIIKDNKLPSTLMKLVYTEAPLDKIKLPSYKKGKKIEITVDEYLKKYLQD